MLVAEDSAVYRSLIKSALGSCYDLTFVVDAKSAWQVLQSPDSPRLLVLDWMLPDAEGVELCTRLRQSGSAHYFYVVLLTARSSEEDLLTAMDAGADDFVRKPFSAAELLARVKAGTRILVLQEQLISAAMYDALTGVLNRGAVFSALQKELSRCRRDRSSVGIILADVDKFKSVNDTYGHQAGDQVLREVAALTRKAVRTYDLVGRYGGEEFLICLPGAALDIVRERAEQIRKAVESSSIATASSAISVTMSMGLTVAAHDDPRSIEQLLRVADKALYHAKSLGRNRVEFG